MITHRSQLACADGALVDVLVTGPDDGVPVLVHHGTPGARLEFSLFANAVVERGLRYVLTGELGEVLAANIREGLRNGMWGWFDDDRAFTIDWGFQLSSIVVPVFVWQGAQDRMVPFGHGEWLAQHIPTAQPRLEPEQGHISLALHYFGRIIDDLVGIG